MLVFYIPHVRSSVRCVIAGENVWIARQRTEERSNEILLKDALPLGVGRLLKM